MKRWNTIVIGSGAAGLSCACQLKVAGVDVAIFTEGLEMGTSFNTGSDKQTYYKLGMYGREADSPRQMAQDMCASGGSHGDIAYVEAAMSPLTFHNLVLKGVPFPHDEFGQHIGYKTDHDPRRRATSCGPYTSKEMCKALRKEVARLEIPVFEKHIAIRLLQDKQKTRVIGAAFLNLGAHRRCEVVFAENVVLAVGGPGELYAKSVYPTKQTGGIGLALEIGAEACNLQESQFGLASLGFRWNVSGSYLQALPRVISTAQDGSDEREFLREYFSSPAEMCDMVFLKGYQWPFAAGHVPGSSLVDLFVYVETELRHRKVWLDYRTDPAELRFEELSPETREYLRNSQALVATPLERLRAINAPAIELYRDHEIDLSKEPLEVGICAQHNNGGLAGNIWWESVNVSHLFPIGEVNGSHGVTRPGGTALNAGQVGAFRAAEFIANACQKDTLMPKDCEKVRQEFRRWFSAMRRRKATLDWRQERRFLQERMTRAGAFLRKYELVKEALNECKAQIRCLANVALGGLSLEDQAELLRTRSLCLAQLCYLEAICRQCLEVGSRGGAVVLAPEGDLIHPGLPTDWRMKAEEVFYRGQALHLTLDGKGQNPVETHWVPCRQLPETDGWFETVWKEFRVGKIYKNNE